MQSSRDLHTIRLEPCLAAQLDSVFCSSIEHLKDRYNLDSVREVCGRLDEACWLATWLRDYTQFDVTTDEAIEVSQFIIAILLHDEFLSESDGRACHHFLELLHQTSGARKDPPCNGCSSDAHYETGLQI